MKKGANIMYEIIATRTPAQTKATIHIFDRKVGKWNECRLPGILPNFMT